MRGNILIIGGYGNVGRVVATVLAERFPGQVIVAGRNFQKARSFASELNYSVEPAKIDISDADEVIRVLENNVTLVVMCVENKDSWFAKQCIHRGIHYIDISASRGLLDQIELLEVEAKENGSTVLLSVGLAPGLTNLLAKHCTMILDDVRKVDIFILLGMGEVHGELSNKWVLDNLNADYKVGASGQEKWVKAFGESKKATFAGALGSRSAFRFNFSDQHTVIRTLEIDSADTWICFESAFFTQFIHVLQRMRVLRLLRFSSVKRLFQKALGAFHPGSDMFVAQVVAYSGTQEASSYSCAVSGRGEGTITGMVAAEVADQMFSTHPIPGVFHIDQYYAQPMQFIETLSEQATDFSYWFATP